MTTLRRLGPYVWHYRTRVVIALLLLVASKVASVGVPIVLSWLVNHLNMKLTLLSVPLLLLAAYGALRISTSLFQEARQVVFARVLARTSREITLKVFWHLHALSLRFHLDRRTGGVAREVERGMVSVVGSSRLDDLYHPADAARNRHHLHDPRGAFRRHLRADHARHAGRVYRVHVFHHRMAAALLPRQERSGYGSQRAFRRFVAELRNGQVLQQRTARAGTFRRSPCANTKKRR